MSLMGEDAIRQLGIFYMSGITDQVSSHFGSIIELRLTQVEALVNSVPPGRIAGRSSMQIELIYNARSAGFKYLAFYTDDGTFHMLYGSQVTPDVPEALHRSVQGGKDNVCAGTDEAGTPVVLIGVPAMYPMENGTASVALVAGLPTSYLSDTLDETVNLLQRRWSYISIGGFISKPLFRSALYYGLRPFIETEAPQPEPEEQSCVDLTGRRILLAEDNELNWEIASEMLGDFGLELEWAENGQICVEKFEASSPGWYDAILMDLRMPVMTGLEAAAAIRGLSREDARAIPIIAVSADAFQDDIQKCLDCGMNAHTAKPLDPEEVLVLLGQYLNHP